MVHARPLCLVARTDQLIGEVERVHKCFVCWVVPAAREQTVTGEVDVLVVDDDSGTETGHDPLTKKPHQSRGTVGN